ncbi:MAG: tetratricopeptide repeat protein [Proteobacteria bacterium]|nr:tetratricopeptide repeat protein [Pseudomonadota bacterium]
MGSATVPSVALRSTLASTLAVAACFVLASCNASPPPDSEADAGADADADPPSFVGSETCGGCHPTALASWRGSPHDRAMEVPGPDSVLGDFEDASLRHFGVESRFFRRGDRYLVETEGPGGERGEFEVRYTFGFEPLQQYLVGLEGGRLQALPFAWDTRPAEIGGQRWFHLYPDERIAPDDSLYWTGRYQSWNAMCAACHSTGLHKGYDADTDSYQTVFEELDVACESCHGPGSGHVAAARAARTGGSKSTSARTGLGVDLGSDAATEIESCAPCHSRRHRITLEAAVPRPLLDHYVPATLRPGLYHPDGQIQDEVYVYGSFLQSRMFAAGVRCSDCHEPHGLGLRAEGDALCTRCHSESPDARFPGLAAKHYDTPEHHFHPVDSEGARCVSCHMPARTYMVVDPRRDHGLRIPRPDLAAKLGTPDVCSDCHRDREPGWAAGIVRERLGERASTPHWSETVARARDGDEAVLAELTALVSDLTLPAIVRATGLELLPPVDPQTVAALTAAAGDRDPQVRLAAVAALEGLSAEARAAAVAPLLGDPIRAVRIEAARVLSSVPPDTLQPAARRAFDAALLEFETAQMAQGDLPSAHLNLGVVHANRRRHALAERAYRTALRLDPGFLPASANLSVLYNELGRNEDAERVLRDALARSPDEGELHYSLGLLLAEQQRLEASLEHLTRATELLPERARTRYNQGLALQQLGRLAEAEAALVRARSLAPGEPGILHALAIAASQQQAWERARDYTRELIELAPEASGPRELMQRIEAELSAPAGSPLGR